MGFYRSIPQNKSLAASYTYTVNNHIQHSMSRLTIDFMEDPYTFNEPISIGDNVRDCAQFFSGAAVVRNSFNSIVKLGNNIKNASSMFVSCNVFNQPVILPESLKDTSTMFNSCKNFNQPINIPNNVNNCAYMFSYCPIFNQSIDIPDSVGSINGLFMFDNNFNGYVNIDSNNSNIGYMMNTFYHCDIFNKPINLPKKLQYLYRAFTDCWNFNQPITIYGNAYNSENAFINCYRLNQPIDCLNASKLKNCNSMFTDCTNLTVNGWLTIPENIVNAYNMFFNCKEVHLPYNYNPDNLNDTIRYSLYRSDRMFSDVNTVYTHDSLGNFISYAYNLTYAGSMFRNCNLIGNISSNYTNGLIKFSNKIISVSSMFNNCDFDNRSTRSVSNIVIWFNNPPGGDLINVDASFMFANSRMYPIGSMYSQFIIDNNINANCYGMFTFCRALPFVNNRMITLGNKVNMAYYMFANCVYSGAGIDNLKNDYGHVYIRSYYNDSGDFNCYGMFRNKSNNVRVTISCKNLSFFNKTTSTTSLTGTAITWTSVGGGAIQNTAYNIIINANA